MNSIKKILIVIPARGGSKGIPRKNLRALAGYPLIYYSIKTALSLPFDIDVYVSSEDDEILMMAQKFGASPYKRNTDNSQDHSTLDPVIYEVYHHLTSIKKKSYDYVITLQPTSPLLSYHTLHQAIDKIVNDETIDTLISVKEDRHLTWKIEADKYVPNYVKRVNRQQLPALFRETGSFLITKSSCITPSARIGKSVDLSLIPSKEAIDIDSYEDWSLCEFYLRRKKILFVVSGYPEIGMGHIYNTLSIANDILNHSVTFLTDKKSQLGFSKIAASNYDIHMQESENILDDILKIAPDVVINDLLDTKASYIKSLRERKIKVINFEDLGDGAMHANLVINAMYPEKDIRVNHYFGPDYFILRDEFLHTPPISLNKTISNILLSFGGVDPNNYTKKILDILYNYCIQNNINITVITGMGYTEFTSIEKYEKIKLLKNISNISNYFATSDIVFTSAGRTTFEVAAIGVPAIVLAQNERELTHFFANEQYGILNLGLGYEVEDSLILETFIDLAGNYEKRSFMSSTMLANNLKKGKKRVIDLINNTIR